MCNIRSYLKVYPKDFLAEMVASGFMAKFSGNRTEKKPKKRRRKPSLQKGCPPSPFLHSGCTKGFVTPHNMFLRGFTECWIMGG